MLCIYGYMKKKAAISVISPDFDNQWNSVLKDAERKLLKLITERSKRDFVRGK